MTTHPSSNTSIDWWRGAIIYEIYPRSFFDANQDGVGDLEGITQKLEYVAGLGVDAVWIAPFFKSPMQDFGYDIADYRAIDPIFGSMDDFDRLLQKAHDLGLKLMIDLVLSHTSDQHPWFQQSGQNRLNSKADWYVWADARNDGSPPNNWLSVFGGSAWEWHDQRQQFYLHHFLAGQPDLNFHHPEVRQQILEETEFWLKKGVDGIRLDVVNYYYHSPLLQNNPPKTAAQRAAFMGLKSNPYNDQIHLFDKSQPENLEFLSCLRKLSDRYPNRTLLGEIGDDYAAELMGQYTDGNDKLHMAYCFRLLREHHSAHYVRDAVEEHERHIANGWPCWSMSNHDTERVATRWAAENTSHPQQAFLYLALLLSLRGSACVYYGEELGFSEAALAYEEIQDPFGLAFWPNYKGRDGCRTPMVWNASATYGGFSELPPWLPLCELHRELAVDRQNQNPQSTLNKFRTFIAWRKQQQVLKTGDIKFYDCGGEGEECLLFSRRIASQQMACAFNLSNQDKAISIPDHLQIKTPIELSCFQSVTEEFLVILPPFQASYWFN